MDSISFYLCLFSIRKLKIRLETWSYIMQKMINQIFFAKSSTKYFCRNKNKLCIGNEFRRTITFNNSAFEKYYDLVDVFNINIPYGQNVAILSLTFAHTNLHLYKSQKCADIQF